METRIFTSHGPTICQPTWFFHRSVFDRQNCYVGKRGDPEDQIFFLRHVLEFNGFVARVEEPLVVYRMHDNCMTNEIDKESMWHVRLQAGFNFIFIFKLDKLQPKKVPGKIRFEKLAIVFNLVGWKTGAKIIPRFDA